MGVLGQVASKVGFAELAGASRKLDIELEIADLRGPSDLEARLDAMVGKHVEAVLLVVGPLNYLLMHEIADLAIMHRLRSPTRTSSRRRASS